MLPKTTNKTDAVTASPEAQQEMSFLDHLEVLRWHVIRALGAILVVALALFSAKKWVFESIIMAPKRADFATYRIFCALSETLCFTPPDLTIIQVGMAEAFLVSLKVSFFLGLILAFPYVFWEIWRFVKPGLYKNEQKVTRGIVFKCTSLFLLGVSFGYYVISPFAINFLASYDLGMDMESTTTLDSYVTFMTMFTLPTGIVFQLPIAVYFLSRMGVVTPAFMRRFRRHAFIIILITAAIITPPDVITQFLIGVPVYLLYEISIGISQKVEKQRLAEAKEE